MGGRMYFFNSPCNSARGLEFRLIILPASPPGIVKGWVGEGIGGEGRGTSAIPLSVWAAKTTRAAGGVGTTTTATAQRSARGGDPWCAACWPARTNRDKRFCTYQCSDGTIFPRFTHFSLDARRCVFRTRWSAVRFLNLFWVVRFPYLIEYGRRLAGQPPMIRYFIYYIIRGEKQKPGKWCTPQRIIHSQPSSKVI